MEERNMIDECYSCESRREVPGDAHIECADPDREMTGNPHGIRMGWFMYPLLFDPVWKTKLCDNYNSVNQPVSQSSNSKL